MESEANVPDRVNDPEPKYAAGAEVLFKKLREEWKGATRFMSSVTKMAMHPAYQQIIGLGPAAVPLLLRELETEPDHWFWALHAITREDPVPPESCGKLNEMARAWLDWGNRKGYKW